MNCSTVRHHLLTGESPLSPGATEARHLAGCAACLAWHRRVVRIEQHLPLVPVPACPVPSSLLDQLRASPQRTGFGTRLASRPRNPEGGRQKLALAFSLAASLAVFAVGWWAWPQHVTPPARHFASAPDPYVHQREQRLSHATTAPQRVAVLADWADEFLSEARQKGNDPARLALLTGQFDRLVQEDLVYQVRLVGQAERRAVASSLALRMKQLHSEANRLASEGEDPRATTAICLRRLAASARAAECRLRQFV